MEFINDDIFVSNDDGVHAEGIRILVNELLLRGHNVYVCAPEFERSLWFSAMDLV